MAQARAVQRPGRTLGSPLGYLHAQGWRLLRLQGSRRSFPIEQGLLDEDDSIDGLLVSDGCIEKRLPRLRTCTPHEKRLIMPSSGYAFRGSVGPAGRAPVRTAGRRQRTLVRQKRRLERSQSEADRNRFYFAIALNLFLTAESADCADVLSETLPAYATSRVLSE
jgi:hypothetical protein